MRPDSSVLSPAPGFPQIINKEKVEIHMGSSASKSELVKTFTPATPVEFSPEFLQKLESSEEVSIYAFFFGHIDNG